MGMEINISGEHLASRKLMVAVPMYGGMCAGIFCRSIADLATICTDHGVGVQFYFLFNESLITRARNYCADEFMRSDCTHLMFIDADIGFDPRDVLAMLSLQSDNPDADQYDIIAGPYPKKCISWEKIVKAVDKGFGDEDPNNLQNFVGDYVFNLESGATEFALFEPVKVLEAGTGFMMIRKSTFHKFAEKYPHKLYRPDHARTQHFNGSRKIMAYFDTPIDGKRENIVAELNKYLTDNPKAKPEEIIQFVADPENGLYQYSERYLSEDYMFCQWVRKAGMHVWLCPWMKLQHVGSYVFGGSVVDLAQIGADPTVNIDDLKKKKK